MTTPSLSLLAIALTVSGQTPSVQQLLEGAVRAGARKLVLPTGRVPVSGRLSLNGAAGLTVEGQGTTLVFRDHQGIGWSFNGCRDLVLRGFTIDYDPLPFVQGRIMAKSADGKAYTFRVCDGYPGLTTDDQRHYRQGYVFEPDRRRWKPWVPDLYARRVEIIDERNGRFIMGYVPAQHERIEVGDRLVLTLRSGGAIRMNDCEDVRIEDVTFLAAPGSAYLGRYMRGDNYYRYVIEPGPPPPGASEPRLISTCADGLNIAFATRGPTIEGCRFSFMGDDSVNLHGVTFAVLGRPQPDKLLVGWPYSPERLATVVPKGSTARRLRPGNYEVLGTARVAAFAPISERSEAHLQAIHRVWPRNQAGRGTVFLLSLAGPLAAEPGDFLDIPESNAPGFVVRDCIFADHRARGLRIMAPRGLIEGNTFRRLKMNAVTIGAEYGFWREAGWVEDIVVRGNTIEDVGRDAAMHGGRAYVLGAISVFARKDRDCTLPTWPGNRDITIEGNSIKGCPMAGVYVAGARGVRVRDNRLENVLYDPGKASGRDAGLRVDSAIDVQHARDVEVADNELIAVGQPPPATEE